MPQRFKQLWLSVAIIATCLASAMPPVFAQQSIGTAQSSTDESHHSFGVAHTNDIRVEYLDWGGSGITLVFVAGMGATPHVFDNFAPRFVDRFRAIGITRIGFGETDQPPTKGYDLESRVEQMRAVLDSLHVGKIVLIGHSLGGDEITAFAGKFPERTLGLIYLDAAIDHTKSLSWDQSVGEFYEGAPTPSVEELRSVTGYQLFLQRLRGVTFPIGEILATMSVDSAGAIRGRRASQQAMMAIVNATARPEFAKIRAPVLALYAEPETAADILPWLRGNETENKRATMALEQRVWKEVRTERNRFSHEVPQAKAVTVHAHHYLFLSDADDTERRIRTFLQSL